jgi:hypothetical protein
MYIKAIRKYCQEEKTTHTYFRLSESYRDKSGFPRQRMVLGLGRLPELSDFDQKVLFLERLNELIKGKPTLFNASKDETVEQLAQHYYGELKKKKKIDIASNVTEDFDTVNLNTLINNNIREIGAGSLCYQALHQLKIDNYLKSRGWDDEQINLAATHIISRAVYPASEHKTVSWIKENSAVCELTGYNVGKVTKDKIYEISKRLYKEKSGLENHLSRYKSLSFAEISSHIFISFIFLSQLSGYDSCNVFSNRSLLLYNSVKRNHQCFFNCSIFKTLTFQSLNQTELHPIGD